MLITGEQAFFVCVCVFVWVGGKGGTVKVIRLLAPLPTLYLGDLLFT